MKTRYLISYCLLFLASCAQTQPPVQNQMKFGLNTLYFDSVMLSLVHSPRSFETFAQQNYIQFLRYPAGTESRTYFWDRPDLIPQAQVLYSNYLKTTKLAVDKSDKAKYNERLATSETAQVSPQEYGDFLKFCKRNGITPIIVLTIWFYHDDNKAYFIQPKGTSLDQANWDAIQQNLKKQVEYSHSVYDGPIYWEVGNEEEHIYSGADYAQYVKKYSAVIKNHYPTDKVMATLANPTSKKVQDNWNADFLSYLVQNKAIDNLDYVAPHYYKEFNEASNDQQFVSPADIAARFQTVNAYQFSQNFNNILKNYPKIHLFYTEFGLFKKLTNPNYNSQLEGLLMIHYLMQFNASPRVDGVIRHGFVQTGSAQYFDANRFNNLHYNFNPNDDPTNGFFKYVSPKAKAIRIFFDNNPVKANVFADKKAYSYTVSNTGNSTIVNLVNYSSSPVPVNVGSISGTSGRGSAVIYRFPDMQSKQWNVDKGTANVSGSIQLPAYSYTVVTIAT